ncbi:MAG: hypothetical protein JXR37_31770 [Kiritimatiellae bacterium]|nr:hypothetical protein [Kiritimatiellia bacterium]
MIKATERGIGLPARRRPKPKTSPVLLRLVREGEEDGAQAATGRKAEVKPEPAPTRVRYSYD